MQYATAHQDREPPETLIRYLVRQLRNQALWDSSLLFCPPLVATVYLLAFLYRESWIPRITMVSLAGAAFGIGLLGIMLCYRPKVPSERTAARLLDEKARAQDRFVTLATLDPSSRSGVLFERLHGEAAQLVTRGQIRRDFPYRLKRSFYRSVLFSLAAAALFHLLLPVAQSRLPGRPAEQRIRKLAERMDQKPGLAGLARSLRALQARLEDPKISAQEKQTLIQEMQKKIQEQLKKEEQPDNRDLLGQAGGTLKGLEQESGGNQQQEQRKGGGGVQSDLSQEGDGESKQRQTNSGEGQGERSAQLNKELQEGKSAQGDPKEQGADKTQQGQGQGNSRRPDPNARDANKPGGKRDEQTGSKAQGDSDEKVGKSKQSEDVPQGTPPAQRYYQAGEQGREGIKDARYVTVQLPEEIAADSKGEIVGTKESKERKSRSKVPVSNVPLPAHVPEAPMEKQQMPLEYRNIIR